MQLSGEHSPSIPKFLGLIPSIFLMAPQISAVSNCCMIMRIGIQIPALRRLMQEDHKFKDSLGNRQHGRFHIGNLISKKRWLFRKQHLLHSPENWTSHLSTHMISQVYHKMPVTLRYLFWPPSVLTHIHITYTHINKHTRINKTNLQRTSVFLLFAKT